MTDSLFLSQEVIDKWLSDERIELSGNVMSVRGDSRAYDLDPAVRFIAVEGDGADREGLVTSIRTLEEVKAAGGDHSHDSVILGDVAYKVQNGFAAKESLAGLRREGGGSASTTKHEKEPAGDEGVAGAATDVSKAAKAKAEGDVSNKVVESTDSSSEKKTDAPGKKGKENGELADLFLKNMK